MDVEHEFVNHVSPNSVLPSPLLGSTDSPVHYRCADKLKVYQCRICFFETYLKTNLRKHLTLKHKQNEVFIKREPLTYKCAKCDFATFSSLVLTEHEDTCLINFRMPKNKRYKQKIVYEKCAHCSYLSPRQSRMEAHIISKHPELITQDTKLYECAHCSHRTRFKSDYERHILVKHTSDMKPYNCDLCPYKAKQKGNLTLHINLMHSHVELFDCEFCPYKAKLKSVLAKHVISKHTPKDHNFLQCDLCDYRTKFKSDMGRHKISKHTPKPEIQWHTCDHCSYKARFKGTLKVHVNFMHSNINKWHECQFCDYKGKQKCNLKQHMLCKHPEFCEVKWFKCDLCPYQAKFKVNLSMHVNRKHNFHVKK